MEIMTNIYDNGYQVIGRLDKVLAYVKNFEIDEYNEEIVEELIEDLESIIDDKTKPDTTIVFVDYDNTMGNYIEYFDESCIVDKRRY